MISDFRSLLRTDPDILVRETLGLALLVGALLVWFVLTGLDRPSLV
jgi:hypothetical protein